MQFPKNFPVLNGERVRMADLSAVTIDEFMPIAMKAGKMVTDRKRIGELIVNLGQGFQDEQTLCWGVFLDAKLIGMCGYFRGFENQVGEIGYILHAEYRGNGYMSEAIELALSYAWDVLDLKRVIAITSKENHSSIKLLEACMFELTERDLEADSEYEIYHPKS